MFENKDKDLDGRLSFEEFMGEECTIEKLFKNMDKNNDGYVTKPVSIILFFYHSQLSYHDNTIQRTFVHTMYLVTQ